MMADRQLSIKEFRKVKEIGSGSFGKVWRSVNNTTGDLVAIKEINLKGKNKKEQNGLKKSFQREVNSMKAISHENVLTLHSSFTKNGVGYLILDLMPISLKELLAVHKDGMELEIARNLCFQLLKAVAHCHERSLIHRDIKPSNLLLAQNGTLKLADFGLSRKIPMDKRALSPRVGTTPYKSPEILLDLPYGLASDLWSVGCVFLEILTGRKIFKSCLQHEVLAKIFQLIGSPIKETWPSFFAEYKGKKTCDNPIMAKEFEQVFPKLEGHPKAIDAAKMLLKGCHRNRPSAEEMLKCPFFKNANAL